MSVGGATGGAAAASAAAAAKKRRMEREEEKMTGYGKGDLEGWEFKIVRTATSRFKNPENVRRLCAEEAKAGWEMVEKFDNNRIRFKRRVEKRAEDQYLDIDPYRTSVGLGEGGLVLAVLGGLALVGLFVGLLFFLRH